MALVLKEYMLLVVFFTCRALFKRRREPKNSFRRVQTIHGTGVTHILQRLFVVTGSNNRELVVRVFLVLHFLQVSCCSLAHGSDQWPSPHQIEKQHIHQRFPAAKP
jgi:hypothetical protein